MADPLKDGPPTSSGETTNAVQLTQVLGKLLESGGTTPDLLTQIAAAITASVIGGSTGGTDNRLLRSKGTTGRALDASPLTSADNGDLSGVGILSVNYVDIIGTSGVEGGEFAMIKPASGSSLAGTSVRTDINTNSWRVFESGSPFKGFNVDITACADGAGTSLLPGLTQIATGSLSGNSTVIATAIPSRYSALILRITDYSTDTAARSIYIQTSTDNSTYDTTGGNYTVMIATSAPAVGATGTATMIGDFSNAADAVSDLTLTITGYQGGVYAQGMGMTRITAGTGAGASLQTNSAHWSTTAITALRAIMSSTGNFDGGTFFLYGLR